MSNQHSKTPLLKKETIRILNDSKLDQVRGGSRLLNPHAWASVSARPGNIVAPAPLLIGGVRERIR